jgi:branched-subunit amino acid aminotransferase/4-amino-4-deoxychorismate lyase
MDIFLNGQFLPIEKAALRVEDAGFQHAVGLFETMAAYHGRIYRQHRHLARIAESAKQLGLAMDINVGALADALEATLKHNQIDRARVRLTMTAGPLSLLKPSAEPPLPTLLIVCSEPTVYAPAYFEQGITVLIAPPLANPFDPLAGHKTLSYWSRLRTLRQAASLGAGEAVILNITNHLAGGAVSNIFIVKDGELFTPIARGEEIPGALPAPVLPGITRKAVIEIAEGMDFTVRREMITVEQLLDADEVFLTNSSWHVLPVSKVEKKTIGGGAAGEVTKAIRAALLEGIEEETSSD